MLACIQQDAQSPSCPITHAYSCIYVSSVVCSGVILELHGEAWTRVCWDVGLYSSSALLSRIHAAAPNQCELACLKSSRSVTAGSHMLHLCFIAKAHHTQCSPPKHFMQ